MSGKICRSGINCRGGRAVRSAKTHILLGFPDGTALADQSMWK
jgi:hypothetical protein